MRSDCRGGQGPDYASTLAHVHASTRRSRSSRVARDPWLVTRAFRRKEDLTAEDAEDAEVEK
jgi:hypothetical protein